jgi:hypothetical protein
MIGPSGLLNSIIFYAGVGVTVIAGTGFVIGLVQHVMRKRRGA